MARICDLCGKKVKYGNNISHSKQHTRRTWLPNIQKATVTVNGSAMTLNLCTRCLRTKRKLAN